MATALSVLLLCNFSWRATDPATLIWAEKRSMAATGMSTFWLATTSCLRRRLSTHRPSKSRAPSSYAGFAWSEQPSVALLTEYDNNRHWRRSFVIDVDDQQPKPR
jgi:hypothetical protein